MTDQDKWAAQSSLATYMGAFDELRDLLELVKPGTDDRLIAVGDLIVKGNKNREVLDLFIDDQRFSSVIGNHDRIVRQFWRVEVVCPINDPKLREYLRDDRARDHSQLADSHSR